MSEETEIVEQSEELVDNSWKVKTLLIGAAIGAVTGLGAAFLLTRRAEQKGEKMAVTPKQGLRLGVMVAGLLRSIMSLGDE
jgi:hypothetical protein